jgi:quercetin dioxygenase-like cupin family protein
LNSVQANKDFSLNGVHMETYYANKNEGLKRHEHTFPHLTVCIQGSCVIRKEGKELVITKDSTAILLKENEWHEIEALEDNTIFMNVKP